MGRHHRAQQPLSSRSFHSNEMAFLHSAVLWLGPHPGWCLGFPPIPQRGSRHVPNPGERPTPCRCVPNDVTLVRLPYSCGALDPSLSTLGGNQKRLENIIFFSLLLWRRTTYFSHAFFFFPVRAYFVLYCASVYVWIWVTFNESLVLSLCVALWASVFVSFLQKEQKIDFLSISGVTTIVIFGCNQTNFSVAWCFQCLYWVFFFFDKVRRLHLFSVFSSLLHPAVFDEFCLFSSLFSLLFFVLPLF